MKLQIKNFGQLTELLGNNLTEFSSEKELTVGKLKTELLTVYPQLRSVVFQVAVNQKIGNNDQKITQEDELALLPPFAGG